MNRFKTLAEFSKIVTHCQCGREMFLKIHNQTTVNSTPSYLMSFTDTKFFSDVEREAEALAASITNHHYGTDKISYLSKFQKPLLHFCYEMNGIEYPILSIDINTNKILQETDKAQRVIWNFDPTIILSCQDEKCADKNYLARSNKLSLERVNNAIYPILLNAELYHFEEGNKSYSIVSDHYKIHSSIVAASNKVVGKIPLIDLYKVDADKILNKIKTFIVFS